MAISEKRRLTYTAVAVTVVGVVTGLVLGAALFSGGTAPSSAADSSPTSSAQASPSPEGAGELFAANCAVCHGTSREGITNLGPPLTQQSLADSSDAEVRDTISHGRLAAGMPSFEGTLSAAEIDALLHFISEAAP